MIVYLLLFLLIVVGLVVGGMVLILAGRVRRKAPRHQCLCGYSLRELSPTSACPECGLARSDSARIRRKRAEDTVALGIALLTIGVFLFLLVVVLVMGVVL